MTPTTKIIVGPCVPGFHGDVARIVELPTGGLRIDRWVKGTGWIEAPKGSIRPDEFMPGACRPASAKDAAWHDIPAAELDNVTDFEIELEKREMNRPRKIYGFLWGTLVSELPSPRHRAKIVDLIKARPAGCRQATPSACRKFTALPSRPWRLSTGPFGPVDVTD
jgi:hypothetical protein